MKPKFFAKSNIIKYTTTVILILAVLLCVHVLRQVIQKGYVSFGPYSTFRVVTGSMEPTLPIGSLLICKAVDVQEIQVGDIVCFRSYGITDSTAVITHRVTAVLSGENGDILLQTKGDANLVADGVLVSERNLIGKVTTYLGDQSTLANVMNFLTGKTGFVLCIGLPTLLIAGMILQNCASNIKGELKRAVEELAAVDEQPKEPVQETLEQMQERIRQELLQELRQSQLVEAADSTNMEEPTEMEPEDPVEAELEEPAETEPEEPTETEPEKSAEVEPEEPTEAEPEEPTEVEPEEPTEVEPEEPAEVEPEEKVEEEPEEPAEVEPEEPAEVEPEEPAEADPEEPVEAEQKEPVVSESEASEVDR